MTAGQKNQLVSMIIFKDSLIFLAVSLTQFRKNELNPAITTWFQILIKSLTRKLGQ